jgi:hypothetical protein
MNQTRGTPIGAQHGALGAMTNSAWRRGYRTGLFEGLLCGFLVAFVIFAMRFFT